MSLRTVKQLHQDISISIASNLASNPQQTAEAAVTELFNTNLEEAQKESPDNPIIQAIGKATQQVTLRDLLVRTGQLQAALEEEENQNRRAGAAQA